MIAVASYGMGVNHGRGSMLSRRHLVAAAAALAMLATAAPASAASPPPWLKLENGVTKPQFAFESAIEETVYVQTKLDTDADGRNDRIRIRISRPAETSTQGIKVPVIFEHSPYRGDLGNAVNHPVDVDQLPQERGAEFRRALAASASARGDLPGSSLDNYYVPRGYAVVLGESIGTFNSDGCPDIGGPWETLATKAVIDWLNGRVRGYDVDGNPLRADWTTGDVGMTGVSYNGTLPNQVATTGVEGLRTIVPVSAISSWYDYYRANGLVVSPHSNTQGVGDNEYLGEDTDVLADFIAARMQTTCAAVRRKLVARQDRETGDYSQFWRKRDYLHRVRRVEASVFVVHGLNDWNVKTKAFASWWERLRVPRKLWLHNGGHGGPRGTTNYKVTENRWFDFWLFGLQNGIMGEPRVTLQREDGAYTTESQWPAEGARTTRLWLSSSGGLSTRGPRGSRKAQTFVDRGRELDTDDVLIQNPDGDHPNRLAYLTKPLSSTVRLSGAPWVSLKMGVENRTAANLTAVLVDYSAGEPVMVTRGWLDPQNRSSASRSQNVRPGKTYRLRWDMQPDDYVFAAGHRIGLVVVSTDHDYTIRPKPGTKLSLQPRGSKLLLPLVAERD
jgi:X-Pro dipeptidyl-peptidase